MLIKKIKLSGGLIHGLPRGLNIPQTLDSVSQHLKVSKKKIVISFLGSNGSRWIALWLSSQTSGQTGHATTGRVVNDKRHFRA